MKISKIEEINGVYHVTLVPNWFERLFGTKEKTYKFKDSGREYMVGGGTKYIREDGTLTGNGSYIGEQIDKWRRTF